MTVAAGPRLTHRFADELGEMAVPWQAADAPAAELLVLNDRLAVELGVSPDWLRSPEGIRLLVGTSTPTGARPVAQAYAGHQFGGFVPRLGDGRALLLGEFIDSEGQLRDLHLKGSGRTPFARGGDGLAAIGPMLREYVISEAMHALGIPSTRSLAVLTTGRSVRRETLLPGGLLARVASSHLRVGSFQYARATGDVDLLRRLADHALARHYPQAAQADRPYVALLDEVIAAQAALVAQWMLIGFVHGVMNTDNMTLSGETIDYGPCAFVDAFDPATVFSSIDELGRYAYENQPAAAEWNLARLAEALLPLIATDEDTAIAAALESLSAFRSAYGVKWSAGMHDKLGLSAPTTDELVTDVLALLQADRVDYTSFFRRLDGAVEGDVEPVRMLFLDLPGIDAWLSRWRALGPRADVMSRVNPAYIPRNHIVEESLAAATEGDLARFQELLSAVTRPFRERPGLERYAEPAPDTFGNYRTFCGT